MKRDFYLNFQLGKIKQANPKILARIIKIDPDSIDYLPANKIKSVFDQFKKDDITKIDPKVLAHVIKIDPDSVYYLPENKIETVFDLLPKSWFTSKIVDKLNNRFGHKDFLQNNFYKYFSEMPLYIPLNSCEKPYGEYSTSHYEFPDFGREQGWYSSNYSLNNAIIWDYNRFEKYTGIYPVYLSKIKLNQQSNIIKLTESYLEIDNYDQLVLSELRPTRE